MTTTTQDETEHVDDFRGDSELLHPSKYWRGVDMEGADVTVTIGRVEKGADLMMAGGKSEQKPVVHFSDSDKALVLNKTNRATIRILYGRVVADWIGKRVTLYAAPFRGADKCVRIRERVPSAPTRAAAQPRPDGWILACQNDVTLAQLVKDKKLGKAACASAWINAGADVDKFRCDVAGM
jgi:hypothetical protein